MYGSLKDLTIVIPTFNRHEFLLRTVKYWSSTNCSIIVMDGGQFPLSENIIEKFNKNISYFHSNDSFSERLYQASKLIKTKYVILSSDDEFFIPSTLSQCINNLDSDLSLSSCGGIPIGFNYQDKMILGYQMYSENPLKSILSDNPLIRVSEHFSNYSPSSIYSVCRSEIWQSVFKIISSSTKEFSFLGQVEILFEILMKYFGKLRIIPHLLWLRSFENQSITDAPDPSLSRNSPHFHLWWNDNIYESKRVCILEFISKSLNLDYKEILHLEDSLNNYSEITLTLETKKINKGFLDLKKAIKKLLERITFLYPLRLSYYRTRSLSKAINNIVSHGVKVNFEDLKKITDSINIFYEKK